VLKSLAANRWLILELTRRDIQSRYRGSVLGMAWPLIQPLLMLLVYTFIFSEVFKARWPGGNTGSNLDAAVAIFTGMIVHGLLAECLTKGPTLVTSNPEFVKKSVFPVGVLAWVALGSAAFQAVVCLLVLAVFLAASSIGLHLTAIYIPLVLAPLALFALGSLWVLAALGAYIRDIGQISTFLASLLLFTSPVFFPLNSLPEAFRAAVAANPLTFFIEESRKVLLWGQAPSWVALAVYLVVGMAFALWAHRWFESVRGGFDDVL
jgi:lipopolysaccharide transport system permease protein